MKVWYFSEMPYPDVWHGDPETLRVSLANDRFDPAVGEALYRRYLDEYALCDELGINIMVNEHHSTATCLVPACNLMLSIMARETKRVRLLALGCPIANRPDPIRVAEELAMIDVISGGRLDMGFVRGAPYEIHPANISAVRQLDRFWEAHDLIMKAMTHRGGPFNWEGDHFHYRAVNIWPRPIQQPAPPVWITATTPASGRAIAERRYTVATLLSGMIARDLFNAYRARAHEQGWTPGIDRFAYLAVVGVGQTAEEGYRIADQVADYIRTSPIVAEPYRNPPGYQPVAFNAAALKAGAVSGRVGRRLATFDGRSIDQLGASIEDLVAAGTAFAGTPDMVFQQIKRFHEHVGGLGHLLMMGQGGHLSHADTVANLTLFSREVLPRLAELGPVEMAAAN